MGWFVRRFHQSRAELHCVASQCCWLCVDLARIMVPSVLCCAYFELTPCSHAVLQDGGQSMSTQQPLLPRSGCPRLRVGPQLLRCRSRDSEVRLLCGTCDFGIFLALAHAPIVMHARTCTRTRTHAPICIHTPILMYAHSRAHSRTRYENMYLCTRVHTHLQTHTHSFSQTLNTAPCCNPVPSPLSSSQVGNAAFHSEHLLGMLAGAIPALVALLRDANDKTRANAAGALGNFGRHGSEYCATLVCA